MNRLLYLIGGAALGIAIYKVFTEGEPISGNGLSRAAGQAGAWGTGQQVSGAGSRLAGKAEQLLGNTIGDDSLSGQGLLDQAKGNLKQAAGSAAQALGSTLGELNR